jgi:branched-subunit amino acid ABC-type transport system permease component
MDTGSTKFKRAKWVATGAAFGTLGVSLTFYLLAANLSASLEAEAALANKTSNCGGDPKPCRSFNNDRKAIESAGQRNELVSRITFGVGLGFTGFAAYLWYKEIKKGDRADRATASNAVGLRSLIASPVVDDGFVGGAAQVRF